jgi:hypothetical protein
MGKKEAKAAATAEIAAAEAEDAPVELADTSLLTSNDQSDHARIPGQLENETSPE